MKNKLFLFLITIFSLNFIISCTKDDEEFSASTLSAPSNLTATGGTGQVTLDWSSVSGASSYTVFWGNSTGITSSSTAITNISTDNYTHSGLDHGVTNYYKVAAVDSAGTGTLSSESNARTNLLIGGTIQGSGLSLTPRVTTLAGPEAGTTTSGDTDGTGSDARFSQPYGMTTDGTNLYVTEFSNNKIRKIAISTGVVTTFAGPAAGTTTAGDTDGTGNDARFTGPFGITTDGTNLYVAGSGNKIRKIVISSGVVTTLVGPAAGTTTSGDADGTDNDARFNSPFGLTTDGTNLYIVCYRNHKVRKIVISTGVVTTYAGPAAGTTTSGDTDGTGNDARFNGPVGITSDGTNFYIGEYSNHKIRQIVISSGVVTTLAGPAAGTTTSEDTDGTGNDAHFGGPA